MTQMQFERRLHPAAKLGRVAGVSLFYAVTAAYAAPTAVPPAATSKSVTPVAAKPTVQPTPVAAPADADASVTLAPEDSISVAVVGHPELSLAEVTISGAGQISHPLGGLVTVGGKTLAGAADAVTKALRVYLKNPIVTVGLVKARPRQVFVVGAVRAPGIINIKDGWRVSEALNAAGSLTERPELVAATLLRPRQSARRLDLAAILTDSNSPANLPLVPGDSLRFDIQNIEITVVGQVAKPGPVSLGIGTHLYDAILATGGTLPRAALSKATVKRVDGTVLPINLLQIKPESPEAENPELKTGDFISVPEQQARITILGDVSRPGVIDLPEGKTMRVADALAAAGGLNIPPRTARIGVARYLPNGRLIPIAVDATALLVDADLSQNAVLNDGDLITVSPVKGRTIFVTGQVKSPGPVQAENNEGLTELLARAGGPTGEAALRKVSVTRRGAQVGVVDLVEAIKGGASVPFDLEDGDYINVPRNEARVLVLPAVRNPGAYPIPEDKPLTVGDALSLAGGPENGARLTEVVILRQTPQGVQSQIVPLTNKPGAQLSTNVLLQSGDVLYVPAGKVKSNTIDTALRAASVFRFLLP